MIDNKQDELMHFRTRGSKNGVRRYQNKDGSLTPLGRIHYGIGIGEGADQRYDKNVQTKTKATEGKASDSFVKSKGGSNTSSLSWKDKLVQKQLERSMKKSVKLKKKEDEKTEHESEEKTSKEVKEKNEKEVKEKNEKESEKQNIKSSEFSKSSKDSDNVKEHNKKLGKQIGNLNQKAKVAQGVSKIADEAGKTTKVLGRIDNDKRMKQELDALDNAELRKINERLQLETTYKNLNKDRMSDGYTRVHNALNLAVPVASLVGAGLSAYAQYKELFKK